VVEYRMKNDRIRPAYIERALLKIEYAP